MDYMDSVLIIGNGAREHAMVKALLRCDRPLCMYAYPGNSGMEHDVCTLVKSPINDWSDLAAWAMKMEIDLTIVGPEIPLVDGIVDIFKKKRLPIFGPTKKAARLEGSKSFAKKLMRKYGIPTAAFKTFTDREQVMRHLNQKGMPIVIKASGLAGGKGAFVCETLKEAEHALDVILNTDIFGEAGNTIVVEEKMEGEEASVFVLTDGKSYKLLPVAQDHKRIGEGDKGPNTGGMGAYAPGLLVDGPMLKRVEKEIIVPTLDAMRKEGAPYTGVLYAGIMITKSGPKVVEFNCRFGDPESQALFPLIECDWFEAFKACGAGTGKMSSIHWSIKKGFCVAVVLASAGYPGEYEKGKLITGVEKAEAHRPDVDVCQAGTKLNDKGKLLTNGGRVLTVGACEETLTEAIKTAYDAAKKISFEGKTFRRDIGAKGMLMLKK